MKRHCKMLIAVAAAIYLPACSEQPDPVAEAPAPQASLDNLTQLLAETLKRFDGQRREPHDRHMPPRGSLVISGTGLGRGS